MTHLSAITWTLPALVLLYCCGPLAAGRDSAAAAPHRSHKAHSGTHDPNGKQRGKASVYSRQLGHHRMADGTPLDLESNAAASTTLPLGSRARVTNLRNGRSAEVVIRDRGPFVKGRIIDLTPHTAAELHFRSRGVVAVEVALIVPKPKVEVATNPVGHVHPIESGDLGPTLTAGAIELSLCLEPSARIYTLLALCR
jgi:rare lipoprotein A